MKDTLPARVRLGEFEFDLTTGELRRGTVITWLTEKPFRVLLTLVEHKGGMVIREEIKRKLWPNDTIVEFDDNINAAIRKLRRDCARGSDRSS